MSKQKKNVMTKAKEWAEKHETGLKIAKTFLGSALIGYVISDIYDHTNGKNIMLHFPSKKARDAYAGFCRHTCGGMNHYSVKLTKANAIDTLVKDVIPDIAEDATVNILVNASKLNKK